MYWKNNEQGIQLLQLLVPIDSETPLQNGINAEQLQDDYMLELICKVIDIKLIPKEQT
jgi:hypothetical protein